MTRDCEDDRMLAINEHVFRCKNSLFQERNHKSTEHYGATIKS